MIKIANQYIYFFIITGLVVVTLFIVGSNAYRGAKAMEEKRLIKNAETIALLLDAREISFLFGNASDIKNPFYVSLKRRIEKLRVVNEDIRFIYLVGRRPTEVNRTLIDTGVFFYVDGEEKNSQLYASPGTPYDAFSQSAKYSGWSESLFENAFENALPHFVEPHYVRSGSFVSAHIPIMRPNSMEVLAVLSVDMETYLYRKNITLSALAPILSVSLLSLLFLFGYFAYKKEKEILTLKSEFVSIASHELRSPLTGIMYSLDGLLNDKTIKSSGNIRDTIAFIRKTTSDILGTVERILDFSSLEHGGFAGLQFNLIDVHSIITDSIETLTLFAKRKGVSISLDSYWPAEILIVGDKEKIKRVFANIIANGIKYSPDGGIVSVSYRKGRAGHVIGISNTGKNISEEDSGKIFSKFFRGDAVLETKQTGTGLGLYFAKQIIKAHGGKIWFTSGKKTGTTFYIILPQSKRKLSSKQ